MANMKVTIVRLCKTPTGWRRYPVVLGKNGKVKPGFVLVDGAQVEYPEGRYQLRSYEGKRVVYKDVGDYTDRALAGQRQAALNLRAKDAAHKAGKTLPEEKAGRVSLEVAYQQFVESAENRGSHVSAAKYRVQIREFIDQCGKRYVDELGRAEVEAHQAQLRARGLADRTVYNHHMIVRTFLKSVGIDTKKELEYTTPRYEKKLPQAYSEEEMERFFNSLGDGQLKMGFSILLMCGLRKRELTNLDWSSVNLKTGVLRVQANARTGFKVKDYEEREITIPEKLLPLMQTFRKRRPNNILVMETRLGTPFTGMLKSLKRHADLAGLTCGRCEGCKGTAVRCDLWFLHKFRSTYVTRLIDSGMPLKDVMRLSGHSQIKNLERYMSPAKSARVRTMVNQVKWM